MSSVSAIICVHTLERWDHICDAVRSLEMQTHRPDELIVAVDNNPDLFAKASSLTSSLVTVVHNTGAKGVSGTRNVAAELSSCDVLAFLDDDAVADPHWLESLQRWYDDPTIVGVGGPAFPVWAGGSRPRWFPKSFDWVVGCSHSGTADSAQQVRNFLGCNMSVRRDIWREVGGFSPDMGRVGANGGGGDETEFCIRVAAQVGGRFMHEPKAVVAHQVPASRQTLRYFAKRCYAEGVSKRRLVGSAGTAEGLGEERSHLRSTLPREFLAGIRAALRGEVDGFAQSLALASGTVVTIAGFLQPAGRIVADTKPVNEDFVPAKVVTIDLRDPAPVPVAAAERSFAVVRSGSKVLGVIEHADGPPDVSMFSSPEIEATPIVPPSMPTVAVVIATRDRPASLRRTLDTLAQSTVSPCQLLVVDSAPTSDDAADVVAAWNTSGNRRITYLRSSRPGLAVAHNLALEYVTAEVVAMTDDDVLIDRYWLAELLGCFAENPKAVCVTGAILPAELETWPQQWVEDSSRFNKGFDRKVFDAEEHRPNDPLFPFSAGTMGSGANMAFVSSWLRSIGGFHSELGAGSPALGGDDLRAFYDVIATGNQLVFNPHAVVFHHHHRTVEAIERQAFGYGAGLTAFLSSVVHDDPSALRRMVRHAPRAIRHASALTAPTNKRTYVDQARRRRLHRLGMLKGPVHYAQSRKGVQR